MTSIKFIHTADLHLDTPFKGLSNWNTELADRLKDATFKSFKNIIDVCLREKVDFLLISGDIFDSENKGLTVQIKFGDELKRLSANGIPAYFICGNHDPLSSWLDTRQLPENVFRFGSSKVDKYTYKREGNPVADIYGISFQNKVIKENLTLSYELFGDPSPVSIALLHGTIGNPGHHENYAPFKVENVINKNFDYWALGHIHKREIVNESIPTIVYPGNPQGRDFGEIGAKGCYLVEIIAGNNPQLEFIPTQIIRFEKVEVDLNEEDNFDNLKDKIEESKFAIEDYEENASYILRVTLKGRTHLHPQLNKPEEIKELLDYFNEGQQNQTNFTWIDRIELNTQPDIDIEQIKKGADFSAEILKMFNEYEENTDKLQELIQRVEELISYQAKRELKYLSENEQNEILEKAKWTLLDQLIREET
ncbi:MAG: metallophosphoesterase [Candidatus Anammoxibacter sp.]